MGNSVPGCGHCSLGCAPREFDACCRRGDTDSVAEDAACGPDCAVDVFDGAVAQSIGKGVVLTAGDVRSCFAQEVDRFVDTAAVIAMFVDPRVFAEILAIIDGCALDLVDGGVDATHGFDFVDGLLPVSRAVFKQPPRGAQVG
jgi:hypothetical protein